MKSPRHLSFCLALFLELLFSQNAAALMATPMEFDILLAPGKAVSKAITVSHSGKRPMSLAVSVKDYCYNDEGRKEEFDPGIIPEGLGQWISVSPLKFDLQPGESRPVTFTVNLPPDASGSHWSIIYITQTNKPKPTKLKKGESGLEIFTFFRSAVRVRQYDPSIKEKAGHISDMNVELNTKTAPLVASVTFENDTKNIFRCKGYLKILNEDGEMMTKLPLHKRGEFTSYPFRPRIVRATMKDKLSPGTYVALAVIDYGEEDLVAGELEFQVK
jgi:hypothetical protein